MEEENISSKTKIIVLAKKIVNFMLGFAILVDIFLLMIIIYKTINSFGGTLGLLIIQCALVYPAIKLGGYLEHVESQSKKVSCYIFIVILFPLLLSIFLKMK